MSDDMKYLTTNSGPQIIKFCNGIIAPLMKNKIPNAPKTFLGKKEEDLADVLDYNCIECFEMQIEEEFSSNSIVITPIEVSKNKRRKK